VQKLPPRKSTPYIAGKNRSRSWPTNLAGDKAEIADQQVAAERTETGGGESKTPRRRERDADGSHPQEGPVLIESSAIPKVSARQLNGP
jgi:hypothetical protein